MYNGIGLQTARGSGTSGYVQKNFAFVRQSTQKFAYKTEEELAAEEARAFKEPNIGILDHERKRRIELKCMELEEALQDNK